VALGRSNRGVSASGHMEAKVEGGEEGSASDRRAARPKPNSGEHGQCGPAHGTASKQGRGSH
jgi:hypothetical protein